NPSVYLNYIASGVLSVRDMGNDPVYLQKLRAGIERRSIDAPDVYPMGFIDKRGPYAAPTGRLVDTLAEARAAVAAYASEGYAGIKLYSSIEPSWIPVLTGDASALGLRTVGHIPPHISPAQAIRSGYREITHINMLLLELIGDLTVDTRTPERFIVPGERGGSIDVTSSQAQAFIDLMLKYKVAHDPTLATFLSQYRSRPGEVAFRAVPYADHLPASLRRAQVRSVSYNHHKEDAFQRTGEVALKFIKRLHDSGVQLLPGTDASLPGFALVSELECYALAGIPNEEVLALATLGTARYMGQENTLGSVEVGKKAYLMLIDGDPVASLSALRKVALVIKGDTSFDAKEILRAQGIRPF
ncbi:amidohydrolase family protein, partial [Steroidobacter sp.]|uniref:amidohydrolase family protein n=1 Tax=Steroidobacter sp. TaxID=1978227 RepID=UPI001A395FF8